MQTNKFVCATLTIDLVPEATNREREVLVVPIAVHVVEVVGEVPTVRVATTVLRRTPEVRVVALVVEIAIVVAVARRQNSEAKGINCGSF